jgi:hypothetical protein
MTTEAEKAARAARQDAVIREADCPICLAEPGERCRDILTGQPGPMIHKARVDRWKADRFRAGGMLVVCDAGDFTRVIDGGHTAPELAKLNRQHAGKP